MMISPETYVDGLRDKSYKEILLEREQMLGYIKEFEEAEGEIEVTMYPTPQRRPWPASERTYRS